MLNKPESGFYQPEKLDANAVFHLQERKPVVVCRVTAGLLGSYFALGNDQFYRNMRGYLEEHTIPFIARAIEGFFVQAQKIQGLTRHEIEAAFYGADYYLKNPGADSTEAYNYAQVVFANMPIAPLDPRIIRLRIPQKWTLGAPRTSIDSLMRLRELKGQIRKIISGRTPPETDVENDSSLLRTYAFFQITRGLPDRVSSIAEAMEQEDSINWLLRDIDLGN